MDSGTAAVLGALVGGLTSLGGTVLNNLLRGRRTRKLERIREKTLRKRFASSKREWVQIEKLMASIGADSETTIRHLLMIGARRSLGGNEVWGLKDWPEPPN